MPGEADLGILAGSLQVGGEVLNEVDGRDLLSSSLLEEDHGGYRLAVDILGLEEQDHLVGQDFDRGRVAGADMEQGELHGDDGDVEAAPLFDKPLSRLLEEPQGDFPIAAGICDLCSHTVQPEL